MNDAVTAVPSSETLFLQGNLTAQAKLERARTELLDLSARNRLLNIPRNSKTSRLIEVVDEKSVEVYRILVAENRPFTFLPGRASTTQMASSADDEPDEVNELAQPEDDSVNERGVLNRHVDTKLQTKLTSKGLQKRLLELYFDARTLEEEQGVNILFLALGTLKWADPSSTVGARHAPLVLIPVSLERGNAAEQFKLRWRTEDIASNLSLEAFLERVHSLKLPVFEAGDEFDIGEYLQAVSTAIRSKEGWSVAMDDIVLGFFSFAKFLMYRDLDPTVWPVAGGLTEQPLIRSLLTDGFDPGDSPMADEGAIDEYIPPSDLLHIVDCDSSQTLAVHDVRRGRNLVIQGPPGTGKSQTIANVIASAVADGKTVLFVAEKMAALEVVKRRLDHAGVGDACLELHSNKANKRQLLDELRRTSELGPPKGDFPTTLNSKLHAARTVLNQHAKRMHSQHEPSGLTPFQVVGQLARLRQEAFRPADIQFDQPETWSADEKALRASLVDELARRVMEIGSPAAHPWNGVGLTTILPTDVERLIQRIGALRDRVAYLDSELSELAEALGLPPPEAFGALQAVTVAAEILAGAPPVSSTAITSEVWDTCDVEISNLIEIGSQFASLAGQLDGQLAPSAWTTDVKKVRSELSVLPADFSPHAFARIATLHQQLPGLILEVNRLATLLGSADGLSNISAIGRGIATGERVAAAPDVSAEVFAASVWDHGVENAGDLAGAVMRVQSIQQQLQDSLVDAAWNTDLSGARQILARYGTSFFRYLHGEWRSANSLVRSFLKADFSELGRIVEVLDKLGTGQKALAFVREHDSFGRAAFGQDWRAERSDVARMYALVEWMRSLRGLGAEPRMIAGRLPDRSVIGGLAAHVERSLDYILPDLREFWRDCGTATAVLFPGVLSVDQVPLAELLLRIEGLANSHASSSSVMKSTPAQLGTTLECLDRLISAQRLARMIADQDQLGRSAFDKDWNGPRSDWALFSRSAQWIRANSKMKAIVPHHEDRLRPTLRAKDIDAFLKNFLDDLERLVADLRTSLGVLFGRSQAQDLGPQTVKNRLSLWIDNSEQLSKWVAYGDRVLAAHALGIPQLVEQLESGVLAPADASRTFDMVYYEALFADQVRRDPAIARFDGKLHAQIVSEFAQLDLKRIAVSSLEVARAHHRKIPTEGGGVGPLGVLRGEMARRRGHMPIRQLMLKAAPAIQALKPVLMMSPLSVAQFLPPGQLTFDLLVMDEASQIQPVDALGAIARCRQVVVVGDERQLPPTKFFAKMTDGGSDESDDSSAQVSDIESILGLFTARGLPQRMLRWHYRSRHQSLIAVSNSQFYENKLFIVPSPYTQEAGMGLRFHHVANGVFDSGNTGTNQVEAKILAEAIIAHAKASPEMSLGVATFSVAQRKAIQDQLELLRRQNPDTEPFFHSHPNEPFFVKNLENVQGDERDVILISVGYGRNQNGYMAMRFGPLSVEGGERRLNVLISRAKRRCEVFASITDEDIDVERGKGKGVHAFKLFLHFARTGRLAMSQPSGREYDSPFEVQVATALQSLGYHVHRQVGIAGFFIDLAIADPNRPGRYILAVECDGASYYSLPSARDRDRLRQAVLEDHGWTIHRIWSTDWFQRPREELQKVVEAIESAKRELAISVEASVARTRAVPVTVVTVERDETVEIGLASMDKSAARGQPYIEATLTIPTGLQELHEAPRGVLVDLLEQITMVEGPVHIEEVVVRLRNAWGLKRAGARIQSAVERALDAALETGRIKKSGPFLTTSSTAIVARNRGAVKSESLRKPEMLPPQEIDAAIRDTVEKNFGASPDEIVQAVSRLLGFRITSSQLREVIQERIDELVSLSKLTQRGSVLVLTEASTALT
jgi:very-short-patch-repair endonuclease